MTTKQKTDWVEDIGRPAFQAIREMVEALTLDWDRLEELREERDSWEPPNGYACVEWGEDADTDPNDVEELAELEDAAGDCNNEDDARQRIDEDPLSIEVGGWWSPGSDPCPIEYRILLATGGPAVRIVGELGMWDQPSTARIEVQNWFKPWTVYHSGDSDHDDILLSYAQCFYFGE